MPCYKLGLRFGRDDILKRLLASGRTGFYFAVLEEGDIATRDPITLVKRDEFAIPVAEITRLYTSKKREIEALRRVVRLEALPEDWRDFFQERLYRATK
jgi:MOSC domain-containing protein YiiM